MAERRMFSKTIIDSDSFLDMPLSAQALYFHLSMRADDDGFINNPKRIQRMIGATDDDYKLLIAKSFVITFESGVIVIKHWRINNYIQKDRYKETVYSEEKELLTVKDNGSYTLCIQDGYNMDTQVSIGKVSIVKDSIDNNIISSELEPIKDQYNTICLSLPKVIRLTESRKKLIKARLKEYSLDEIISVFEKAEASDFLSGRNKQWTGCNFDWLMKPSNIVKVIEGTYDNKGKATNGYVDAISNRYDVAKDWLEGRAAND